MWRKKLEADKTCPVFKAFFTNANQDLRQSKATTASAGYHPAATIDLQHTLNTLTTAIESDQSTITNMTAHNNHLTQQLTQAIAGLGTATDNIATLQSQLNALTYSGRGGGGDGGSGGEASVAYGHVVERLRKIALGTMSEGGGESEETSRRPVSPKRSSPKRSSPKRSSVKTSSSSSPKQMRSKVAVKSAAAARIVTKNNKKMSILNTHVLDVKEMFHLRGKIVSPPLPPLFPLWLSSSLPPSLVEGSSKYSNTVKARSFGFNV